MLVLMKRAWKLLWLLALGVTLSGAHGALMPAVAAEADKPRRIVSIGGDVTETLFALGLGNEIVAVDTTSQHPPAEIKLKKSVGYMRALSTEGVLSVEPTLIIASGTAGPPEVVAALKASSVPFVEIETSDSADGVTAKVRRIAEAVGKKEAGEALATRIGAEFATLAQARSRIGAPAKALFVLSVQGGRALVAGAGTSADAMFQLAGAENAALGLEGFKPISAEAVISAAPEFIVVMGRDGSAPARDIAETQGFATTPAVQHGRVIEFDGSYLLQFGPRAAQAATDLMRKFHPEVLKASRQ